MIQNQDMDLQSENMLNIDNLILFNVGGLSTYEVSSLEKAIKNKQLNMNLIYGSNQIYNHEEYLQYIKDYFKGNSGIVKDININVNKDIKNYEEENDSRENLNFPHDTIDILNDEKPQYKNNINKNNSNNYKDTFTYDGNPANSIINVQEKNIRNTVESDISDIK